MSCCQYPVLTVIGNNALATPTASPVVLTVDKPLTDMPANGCFVIRAPKALLRNVNANTVQITDGATIWDVLTCCATACRSQPMPPRPSLPPAGRRTDAMRPSGRFARRPPRICGGALSQSGVPA